MIKRIFDICFSLLLIVFFAPIFIFTYIIVLIDVGRPVIFKQKRVGRNNSIFTIYKFRTMRDRKGRESDIDRTTRLGKILREFSVDELPEFFNVLKGDMSLVGPRPLLVEYLPLYSARQLSRHQVRPGITGLAQVNGRNAAQWKRKFALDIIYIKKRSMCLDCIVLAYTVRIVFSRKGINLDSKNTMKRFTGSIKED